MPPKKAKDQLGWQCKTCQKKYTKETDKVMECEYCENYFCITCIDMSTTAYTHLSKSSAMWFCTSCMPKIRETIKIEKDIEKRCSEHYEKLQKICQDMENEFDNKFTDVENKVDTKCSKQEVEAIVNDKLKTLSVKGGDEEITKMVQTTVTDMVDTKIQHKLAESGKEIADRKSREKNIIMFKAGEPDINIIEERVKSDKEFVGKILNEMHFETREHITIEKVIRLGKRKENPLDNPRPLIVTFSTVEAKKEFLKNSMKLKESSDEGIKTVSVQNDMIKQDREREQELVQEKFSKNSEVGVNYRYVIRGPPGERKLVQIRRK